MLGYRMGLKPEEIRKTLLYDFNLMATAFYQNIKHDYEVMRMNAFLVSAYSGLDGKTRKKLSPKKMFPFTNDTAQKELSQYQVMEILARSNRRRGIA